ncbi:hypothetical protein IFR09_17750 [Pseudomonas syringae]|nr:hypothetical protein [Pseudomonas syringae]MBD8576414.1 hypothetical protein [Pseudomonas syringae]MBD8791601.1 hypothetical protein [Pseudomonas syringae]MBD8802499.1 hypothetical protein [Pseudomonas syringae]MBD8813007.1 hypothetical protein [Pseudomonas syringae]
MNRRIALLGLIVVLAGCQSTHEQLLAEGYPPAFADGFQDGCGSGRQAAGAIGGQYRKNVPRDLKEPLYAKGWADGFRQCQAMQVNHDRETNSWGNDRDREWERQKTRDKARAYRPD